MSLQREVDETETARKCLFLKSSIFRGLFWSKFDGRSNSTSLSDCLGSTFKANDVILQYATFPKETNLHR